MESNIRRLVSEDSTTSATYLQDGYLEFKSINSIDGQESPSINPPKTQAKRPPPLSSQLSTVSLQSKKNNQNAVGKRRVSRH